VGKKEYNDNFFNIAFNVCNMNKDASTYQKMDKILKLINTSDMVYQINYDRHIFFPQIDHEYSLDDNKDSYLNNILLIDTNFNPIIGDRLFIDDNLYKHVNKEFTQLYKYDNIKQFNILPQILELLNKNSNWTHWLVQSLMEKIELEPYFTRSYLINCLLALGYQTINIVDLSCRSILPSHDAFLEYNNVKNKYVCESINQPNHHIEHKIDN
jgi:hypothetical protein